jgi:choline dehydrogenase-like flavoprotein
VFPTSAASNPTLTIAALALKAVRPIQDAVRT